SIDNLHEDQSYGATLTPHSFGYQLARQIRSKMNLQPVRKISSISEVANATLKKEITFEQVASPPISTLRAIVGETSNKLIVAGNIPHPAHAKRFLEARCIFHAINYQMSQLEAAPCRLVTSAFSWDQKASRAFAAELLAPRQALLDRLNSHQADIAMLES